MSAIVTYKGNTLTTINNETKILETAGTWLEGDITIEDETQAESIVAEDIPNATGVECQITGDYSGGTITQDANGYIVLSASGDNTDTMKQYVENTLTSFTDVDVTEVRPYAFDFSGTALTTISLPNATKLKNFVFYCSEVVNVSIPKAAYLEGSVFKNCKKIVNLALPSYIGMKINDSNFEGCTSLEKIDFGANTCYIGRYRIFWGDTVLSTIVFRSLSIIPLLSTASFTGTPFTSDGTGGTIYIPKSLYDHLGDGTALDYKSDTNWSTIDGYGTITWAKIEGSQYENAYVDGTLIE